MNQQEIKLLLRGLPQQCSNRELIETHISWVILCDKYVYKIKKPIQYSFLDFSTLEKRYHYCMQEIRLNWRLTFNVYLDIQEIKKTADGISIGPDNGQIIDYAVRMIKLPPSNRMDLLLSQNLVTDGTIDELAKQLASFHQKAEVIKTQNVMEIGVKFKDLKNEVDYLETELGGWAGMLIRNSILTSNQFLKKTKTQLEWRLKNGFYRDGHGDLHTRNIFLLPKPVIFDCIEFDDKLRQIDILNEVAFLCMDLDALGKSTFSNMLLQKYCEFNGFTLNVLEKNLFVYYKAYRANVRAKINSLRARGSKKKVVRERALEEVKKYLHQMESYLRLLTINAI